MTAPPFRPANFEGDSQDEPQDYKARLGGILRRMRQAHMGTLSMAKFAEKLGCSVRQILRTEGGTSLSPVMIDLYEKACGDRVLVFLGSEHPPGCAGSLAAQKEMAEKLAVAEGELHKEKVENGRLRGILKRQDRILQELRAAGIVA